MNLLEQFDPAKQSRCKACKKADCDFERGTALLRLKLRRKEITQGAAINAVMDDLCSCPCHDVRGAWLILKKRGLR